MNERAKSHDPSWSPLDWWLFRLVPVTLWFQTRNHICHMIWVVYWNQTLSLSHSLSLSLCFLRLVWLLSPTSLRTPSPSPSSSFGWCVELSIGGLEDKEINSGIQILHLHCKHLLHQTHFHFVLCFAEGLVSFKGPSSTHDIYFPLSLLNSLWTLLGGGHRK